MKITSQSFAEGEMIPTRCAFAEPAEVDHVKFAGNRNPQLSWSEVPEGTKSFALLCIDPDAPTVPDDVNQEGRSVPRDLPRADFVHWAMVDVPADCREIAEGSCSDGVVPGGKPAPAGPEGSRQGLNDYVGWFAGQEGMAGDYLGYDGPAPPWNDERIHRYRFTLFALSCERCPVEGAFSAADVKAAIADCTLAEATTEGRYTQNPALL